MNSPLQSTANVDELAVKNLSKALELAYEEKGTRFLYSDEEIVFMAASWLGYKPIIEDMLQLRRTHEINLNLSFHGPQALSYVIKRASAATLLPGEEPENALETSKTIEIIQLMVTHGIRAKDEHLKEAISGKNLELVQYLVTHLGLDVSLAIRNRVPGADHIREWAKEWKKVNKLKTKLSSSLNKETNTPTTTRNKI